MYVILFALVTKNMSCKFMLNLCLTRLPELRQISENRSHRHSKAKNSHVLNSHSIKIIDFVANNSKANKT